MLRRAAIIGVAGVAIYVAFGASRVAGVAVAGGCVLAWLGLGLWLPRAGHRAFLRGDYRRARVLYRLVWLTSPGRERRLSAQVSVAACDVASGHYRRARRRLARLDPAGMADAVRAAWLNNQAYASVRDADAGDAREGLALSEAALALRPDVPAFRHTRGIALLALGRLDEAVRELDRMWAELATSDPPAVLEAERCFDLGCAWVSKGHREYATDYFRRAVRAAPASPWGQQAAARLGDDPGVSVPLTGLV